jgi:hypothetical protein
MEQKPSRFIVRAEQPVQFVGAETLLAGRHQLRGQSPLCERDMRTFHDGAHRDAERLATVLAVVNTWAKALALHLGDPRARHAAARAHGTAGPGEAFQMVASRVFIVENRVGDIEFAGHLGNPVLMTKYYPL